MRPVATCSARASSDSVDKHSSPCHTLPIGPPPNNPALLRNTLDHSNASRLKPLLAPSKWRSRRCRLTLTIKFVTHSRRWAPLKTLKRKRQPSRVRTRALSRASLAAPRTLSFPSNIPRATRGSAQCVREGVATPWFLVKDESAIAGSPKASVFGDCEV